MSKEGFLCKEGGALKGLKKRYYKLDGSTLKYSKSDKDKETQGSVDLKGAEISKADKKKKGFWLEIVSTGKTHTLSCDSDSDCKAWIEALKAAAAQASSPESNGSAIKAKIQVSDFQLLNTIGKGSFGKVMQVKKIDTGRIYAMKVLSKKHIIDHNEVEHTKAERSILERLDHPFLIKLNYSFQSEDKLYFIMDYVNGGELFFHLQKDKKFPEERVRFYAAEIVLALDYLHDNGVIYRDLKPENLLLTDSGHIIMTDFGLCKEGLLSDDDRTGTFCGTPEYLAPEVLKGQGYTKAVDWWSFGSLVFEMLTGLPPFYSQDVQEMYRKIMTDTLKFPAYLSEDAKDILSNLLQRDLAKRLTEADKIKKSPFFSSIDWHDVYNKKIPPPFMPPVKGEHDVSQIDKVFTDENPDLNLGDEGDDVNTAASTFEGFTFTDPSVMSSAARAE